MPSQLHIAICEKLSRLTYDYQSKIESCQLSPQCKVWVVYFAWLMGVADGPSHNVPHEVIGNIPYLLPVKPCIVEEACGSLRMLTSSPSLLVYVSSTASPSWCLKCRPFQMALSQPLLPPWRWCDPSLVASCKTALQQTSICSVQRYWKSLAEGARWTAHARVNSLYLVFLAVHRH